MRGVRRIVVLTAELIVEAVLLGCLLGVLVAGQIGLFYGVLASTLAIPVVLFIHWYYLTRVLAGIVLRIQTRWAYPATAAALFLGHMYFALARAKNDLSLFAHATEFPFLAGGACIVFTCASMGDRLLRKWKQTGSHWQEQPQGGIVRGSP
jgi:hypothetical protein